MKTIPFVDSKGKPATFAGYKNYPNGYFSEVRNTGDTRVFEKRASQGISFISLGAPHNTLHNALVAYRATRYHFFP